MRVPLLNASLTDCVFEVERATSAEEVNAFYDPFLGTTTPATHIAMVEVDRDTCQVAVIEI